MIIVNKGAFVRCRELLTSTRAERHSFGQGAAMRMTRHPGYEDGVQNNSEPIPSLRRPLTQYVPTIMKADYVNLYQYSFVMQSPPSETEIN